MTVELLKWRPSRLVVLLVASGLEVAAMALLGLTTTHHEVVGLTGAVAVLVAVAAAILAGPWVGGLVAAAGGVAFLGFVADFGDTAPMAGTVISTSIWGLSAVIAGVVADRLRYQEAARRAAEDEAARLHARLESSLLPRLEPEVGGLQLAWRYLPGEERLGIGGDFYDVAVAPDGAPAVVIGDVVGHGPDAAALGATLRAGWHALVTSGVPVDSLVSTLGGVLAREQPSVDAYATLCLAWLGADCASAAFVLLGHPPPILLADGRAEELRIKPLPPLGVAAAAAWGATLVDLPATWSLLFYTDGLIEGRVGGAGTERYGVERLLMRLRQDSGKRLDQGDLDRVLTDVVAASGGSLPDDVAVLCVSWGSTG
jgi:serine phosphatase RsbU (regulator of sigma subunit)